MNISIIAVGSELLLGQIANTNGQYLSKLFNEAGHNVVEHTVIGDNPERLENVLKHAISKYDSVILTGGLGPTKDDLTKHTVAKLLGRELVIDQHALDYIEQYFKEQGTEMTPNNRQQALVISQSHVLENKHGMAPGMLVEQDGKHIALLPGPPKEMKPMAKEALLPYFLNGERTIFSESLRFAGIGESKVETELLDLIDNQSNPTIAPLAGTHEVNVRLTANAETEQACKALIGPIKAQILQRIGQFYYGSDDTSLEQAVMENVNQSIALYDGVTEGIVFSRMKDFDTDNALKGMLSHNEQFVSTHDTIEAQLSITANIIKDLFKTDIGISILHENDSVYLGILKHKQLTIQSFKMPQRRNLIKYRTPNYVLMRLLNWLK